METGALEPPLPLSRPTGENNSQGVTALCWPFACYRNTIFQVANRADLCSNKTCYKLLGDLVRCSGTDSSRYMDLEEQ
eukprot:1158771-Pelagomonas_calceolata.AAC.2